MRNLIDLIQRLDEDVKLSAGEITKYPARFSKFIQMIRDGEAFYDVDRQEVYLDPSEADRIETLHKDPAGSKFKGIIKVATVDGQIIPLNKLLKTKDLGGDSLSGKEGEVAGKNSAALKPNQIGITDQEIQTYDFGEMIVNNPTLNGSAHGKAVIQMAEAIMAGDIVVIPEEYRTKENEKIRKAIVDYAGEYLGVLALIYNQSRFPRKESFERWLGASIGELVLNFPSSENNPLADSLAVIKNPTNSHTVNISSKGTGGGAAPAVSKLIIPDDVASDPSLENAVKFIKICQEEGTMASAFKAMNLIHSINPQAIPKQFRKFLPWTKSSMDAIMNNYKQFNKPGYTPLTKFQTAWADIDTKGDASDAGKLTYAVKKGVLLAMNEGNAIPEFENTVMQVLNMNFVQQYADYEGNRTGVIKYSTQWPAKLDGHITVEDKSSAPSPTSGGFSFKLSRDKATDMDDFDSGEETAAATDDEFASTAAELIEPKRREEPENTAGIGRSKRKR